MLALLPRRRCSVPMATIALAILVIQKQVSWCDGFGCGQSSLPLRFLPPRLAAQEDTKTNAALPGSRPYLIKASLCFSSRRSDDWYGNDKQEEDEPSEFKDIDPPERNPTQSLLDSISAYWQTLQNRRPPPQVEDVDVLFYDIFLIINLTVSISFWVVHRLDVSYLGAAFNEGCLMCLLWIGSGLSTGAFLNSAVDGHFGSSSERGGPKAAAMLALHTFLNAINLRLLFALAVAVVQHRPVGIAVGEQLMPLELGFGLCLMMFWRLVHSSFVPRV
jgi:hypothetical protein